MKVKPRWMSSDWAAVTGVCLGLIVALVVDRQMVGSTDRPLVIAGVTALVALVWIAGVRLVAGPPKTPAPVRVRRGP